MSLITSALLIACTHNAPTPNPPQAAEGTGVPEGVRNAQNEADLQIAEELANARCDRAESCNDVGQGRIFVSRQLCMDQVRGNIANVVNASSCPRGLDNDAINRCRAVIGKEECGKAKPVSDHDECRAEHLCLE